MKRSNRWYDAHAGLGEAFEGLKSAPEKRRDEIVAECIAIISKDSPSLIEKHHLEFPLDRKRRRWYDEDPYLWLMVNGLRYAKPALLDTVTKFLEKALTTK